MRCAGGPIATFHFPDPETLVLRVDGRTHRLGRQRTASGARYADERVDFWNKGQEVTLSVDDQTFTCTID